MTYIDPKNVLDGHSNEQMLTVTIENLLNNYSSQPINEKIKILRSLVVHIDAIPTLNSMLQILSLLKTYLHIHVEDEQIWTLNASKNSLKHYVKGLISDIVDVTSSSEQHMIQFSQPDENDTETAAD